MKYLSVCSGIEAASVAWHPLGFEPVGFSEIEKFPAAVLRARFPHVQNFGDMNGFESWDLEAIDILVGGTPCQSFSVAGLRKGMADSRGNLALVYCRILDRFRPKWFVWENVPGVLSSGHGRDFGSFLGAVAKLGYGFAYRVLDAQWFGVPQRRRRVFVVGCLGDWRRAAAILFERDSLQRNPTPGPVAKQKIARSLRGRAQSSHREDSETFVTHSLRGEGFDASEDGTGRGTPLVPMLSHACLAKGGSGRLDPTCETFIACTLPATDGGVSSGMHPVIPCGVTIHGTDKTAKVMSYTDLAGSLRTKPPGSQENSSTTAVLAFSSKDYAADAGPVSPTLRAMGHSGSHANAGGQVAIAFDCRAGGETGLAIDEIPGALRCHDGGHAAVQQAMQVRRLTPRECERLQGFPDDWTLIEYGPTKKKLEEDYLKYLLRSGKLSKEDCFRRASDGPRYKAIGNSMAVPVMRWIGERLSAAI